MRRGAPLAVGLVLALAAAACGRDAPTIVCLGDSITEGVTTVGSSDAEGGYPGRLQRRLGARARVVNRGVGGASTRLWLLDPAAAARESAFWKRFQQRWNGPPPPPGRSLVRAVLERDRPDVVVVFLGVNDVYYERGAPADEVAERAAARLATIAGEIRAAGATVLVATALPNRRDAEAGVAALNARIEASAADHLATGRRFAAHDWPRLLADEVHPNAEGYRVLADIVGDELERRGLVRTR